MDSQDFGQRSEASPRLRVQHPWILTVGRYGAWVGQLRSLLWGRKKCQLLQLLLHPPAPTLQPGLAGSPRKDSADGPEAQPRASLSGTSRECPGAIELPTFWSCFQTPKQAAPKLCALNNANWGVFGVFAGWGMRGEVLGPVGNVPWCSWALRAPVGSGELRAGSCGVSLPAPSP